MTFLSYFEQLTEMSQQKIPQTMHYTYAEPLRLTHYPWCLIASRLWNTAPKLWELWKYQIFLYKRQATKLSL